MGNIMGGGSGENSQNATILNIQKRGNFEIVCMDGGINISRYLKPFRENVTGLSHGVKLLLEW